MIFIKSEELKEYIFNNIHTGYYVSKSGDIYSTKHGIYTKMQDTKTGNGYRKVRLSINGHVYNTLVHRIVAETFIPNPENKPEVNHIDGIKYHNYIGNLEWATRKENAIHAYEHKLFGGFGEDFPTSTISNDDAITICNLLVYTDMSQRDIAKYVGCSKKIVNDIFTHKTWNMISDKYDFSSRRRFIRINNDIAKQICELLEKGISSKEISDTLGCAIHNVKDIKRHKTWTNVSHNYNF